MRKEMFQIILIVICIPVLLAACGPSLPSSSSTYVNVLEMKTKVVTLADLQAAFSGSSLTPPLYEQSPGTTLYGIVIPFDIPRLPDGVNFTTVHILLSPLKSDGGWNKDVNKIAMIPENVDKVSDVTEATNIAADISATISILSGKIGVGQEKSESYQKIYRSVAIHEDPEGQIRWDFTPFLDEPIHPGLYYVVAVYEIPNGTTGNEFIASSSCAYGVSSPMGEKSSCGPGAHSTIIIP